MRIFGAILAGGQGRRMGGPDGSGADKALLGLGGKTLVARAIDRLEPQVERLAISANGDPARLAGLGLPVLADHQPLGPLAGALAALDWAAARGATAVVTVAVDTPFFPGDLVPRLCLAAETSPEGLAFASTGTSETGAGAGRDHPTFALWPVSLRDSLSTFLASGEKPKVLAFALAHGAVRASFPDDGAFANLNTPADLARAEALLERAE